MFYEDDDEYIPLKITLLDVQGYYNILENDSKTMNFKLDDDSLGKIIDIFDHYSLLVFIIIRMMTIIVSHILKQKYLMILVLEKTMIKLLSIIVEFYYNTICLL